ncbi:Matrix metalloproteinase-B [Parelaphostrongylus tenuis]|uniref:Matrix metalloproteinase-B n=1 Tax=Parelaphostrongylus tenuis TaxID=148309 RepID=A0AAD5MW28_PARTN|nr:Matrix metalloproteinase-B [Parelaphostrongylus tenuis]
METFISTTQRHGSDRRFFPYVLAHEIGHALGLQHAKKQEAIMYPYYKNTPLDEIKLDLDDKCAINWNYALLQSVGLKAGETPTTAHS